MTSKKTSLDETKLINSNEKKFKPGDGIKLQPLSMKIKFKIDSPNKKRMSRIVDS